MMGPMTMFTQEMQWKQNYQYEEKITKPQVVAHLQILKL